MEIKDLKRNSGMIAKGQWIGEIPDMGDLRLLVRGLTSPSVSALRAQKERSVPRKHRQRDGSLKMETALRISSELLHEVVLLDWDGITMDGKPVKYDATLAKEWLTDPDYQDFANAVAWAAMVADRGEEETTAELVGNSSKP